MALEEQSVLTAVCLAAQNSQGRACMLVHAAMYKEQSVLTAICLAVQNSQGRGPP